ncbi:MAG: DapH/DapD/GlmU-related protein [Rhodoglobus sp.]
MSLGRRARISLALANGVASSSWWSPSSRASLLRRFGAKIATGARVYHGIRFVGRVDLLELGGGSFLNVGVTIGSNAAVTIGSDVAIGPGVQLLPTTHELGPASRRAGRNLAEPIRIGDGAWIGAGAIILSGVTVGAGAVVAAGAVVTADCEPHHLYGGVPAKIIRAIDVPGSTDPSSYSQKGLS